MGFFDFLKKKDPPKTDINMDWPWTLTVGPRPPVSDPSWADIQRALEGLVPDGDSFVILERKDPSDPGRYWFLQSAIALAGPHIGQYIVGCGYSLGEGRALLERYTSLLDQVIPDFDLAYRRQDIDLSGFEDHSDMLR